MKIYTDVEQCGLFGAKYFGVNEVLVCTASALLRSKNGDYEPNQKEYLETQGEKTLVLERTTECDPGWWEIIKVI
jgi:hypothetical protein